MSSKGTNKFVAQRASAVLLIPILMWFLIGMISHAGAKHGVMVAWLSTPLNAVLMGLFVIIGAFHMRIGLSEIIDDYIHSGLRGLLMLANWVFAVAVTILSVWSVWTLAFG